MTSERTYPRFSRSQRIEHVLAIVSFTVLALTGLPQKSAATELGAWVIGLLGGIELVRVIHRIAAVVLMGETIYHVVSVVYKVVVRRARMTMLPTLTDARDAWQSFLYNLGFSKTAPQAGRYHFG